MKGKTVFISGASRGIGKAIALKLGAAGANIIVAAKSVTEDPRLGGTIHTTVDEVKAAGGDAIATQCDIRFEEQIVHAIKQGVEKFGGIDAVINNASAISLTNTDQTTSKRFDLMHDINVRGTFLVTKYCIPFLKKSDNPHILMLSPPISMHPKWLAMSLPYTMSKFNMTMMALGWAAELKEQNIASNSLWPATTIATAAVQNLLGGDALIKRSRTPDIVADTVLHILQQPSGAYTGQSLIDEEVLKTAGVNDFTKYAVDPNGELQKDLFLD